MLKPVLIYLFAVIRIVIIITVINTVIRIVIIITVMSIVILNKAYADISKTQFRL